MDAFVAVTSAPPPLRVAIVGLSREVSVAAAARAINGPDVQGELMRLVRDYIAGMTDRYCLEEHRRLFGHAPELRLSFKGV